MEIEVIKKLVKKHYLTGHLDFMRKTQVAERYYRNKNDILYKKKSFKEDDESENPLRNADNRISSNFYNLLVNQKASYMFTAPPLFDVGDKGTNEQIADFFGDKYAKVCKDLCINASNSGVGWLHIWRDENDLLKYGVINSKQIIPIWSDDIEQELKAVLRIYPYTDENGEQFKICQYWNKEECYSYIFQMEDYETFIPESFKEFDMFTVIHSMGQFSKESVTKHNFGEVPFIPFFNNNSITSDLDTVKPLIDTYDKVFSGFINDLEDIQEIIFVLNGYDGEELGPFLNQLKKYKTVKVNGEEGGDLRTLTIDIPVEAREKMLSLSRKAIFEQGQGVDPDPQNFGNSSGVALKFLYSLLELKAGLAETEFKLGFGKLIRMVCKAFGKEVGQIIQTWTRTAITNDAELADICNKSSNNISKLTLLKNHPFVENAELEIEQLNEEKQEALEEFGEGLFVESMKMGSDKVVTDDEEKAPAKDK